MGYNENAETGTWVHKRMHQGEAGNDNDDKNMPLTASNKPSSSTMRSSSAGNHGFAKADHAMTSHLDDIDQHIRCILKRQQSLEAHIVQLLSKEGH
ncbi:Uncharacterized protein TCM_033644 [Theobroma cacao]|uniref:Uncharacterized protein n=1 Tax=Theobroma cacao TaxID=3641 RepID=A0A061FIJ1_THECC|nr:Uncharacterized protein TCM_033644 [Theobroma cacao]